MIINKNNKVHECCSTDVQRPALNHVLFNGERLIATDGHILASVAPESLDGEAEKALIPVEALKTATKPSGSLHAIVFHADNETMSAFGGGQEVIVRQPADVGPDQYPNCDRIMPPEEQIKAPQLRIGLNAKLLLRLAKALGTDALELRLPIMEPDSSRDYPMKAIYVVPLGTQDIDEGGPFGLIMPMKCR